MPNDEKPQLNFYGDLEEILGTTKLVTIRKPAPKYDLKPGTEVEGNLIDAGLLANLVVIANDTAPIIAFSIPSLVLDGYVTAEQAAQDLKRYPGYEDVTPETPMQRIAFICQELWDELTPQQQQELIEIGLEEALQDNEFTNIFIPAIFTWLLDGGLSYEEVKDFCKRHGLPVADF